MVWAGASYKQDFGISALGGVKLQNALAIGASYSIQQSGLDELNSPSFEVSLSYLFGKRKRDAAVYSFVNTEKVKERSQGAASRQAAARQKQIEAEQKRREEVARVKEEQQKDKEGILANEHEQATVARSEEQKKHAQAALKAQAGIKEEADVKKSIEADKLGQAEADKQKRILAEQEAAAIAEQKSLEEEANIRNTEARAQEREAKARETGTDVRPQVEQGSLQKQVAVVREPAHASEAPSRAVRHEIVKSGNHPQELEVAEYVVVGVFRSIENAKHFSDGLRTLGFNAQVGHVSQKNQWYAYVFKASDTQRTRAEHARISKTLQLRDAWLLTVEP